MRIEDEQPQPQPLSLGLCTGRLQRTQSIKGHARSREQKNSLDTLMDGKVSASEARVALSSDLLPEAFQPCYQSEQDASPPFFPGPVLALIPSHPSRAFPHRTHPIPNHSLVPVPYCPGAAAPRKDIGSAKKARKINPTLRRYRDLLLFLAIRSEHRTLEEQGRALFRAAEPSCFSMVKEDSRLLYL